MLGIQAQRYPCNGCGARYISILGYWASANLELLLDSWSESWQAAQAEDSGGKTQDERLVSPSALANNISHSQPTTT